MKVTCFCLKNQASKVGFVLFLLSLNLNCFVRSGRGRASVVCWVYACVCCGRGERRRFVGESEANKGKQLVDRARHTDVVFLRPANLARRCYGSSDDERGRR